VGIPPQAFENKMKDFVCKCMEGDGPTPHVKNASRGGEAVFFLSIFRISRGGQNAPSFAGVKGVLNVGRHGSKD